MLKRICFTFLLATLLVGCPAKTKILYLKITVSHDVGSREFLEVFGKGVTAPLADSSVGFDFLKEKCEHRKFKSQTENTLLGGCAVGNRIYIYALLPDHGGDPKDYLNDSGLVETISNLKQFKKNSESYFVATRNSIVSENFNVITKSEFVRMAFEDKF